MRAHPVPRVIGSARSAPRLEAGDQAKMDSKVPQIATKTIDSNVTRNAAKTLIRPRREGGCATGYCPCGVYTHSSARMPASRNTRPKVRYQPVLGMIRPVTRTP